MILTGPSTTFRAARAYPAIVQVKRAWGDDWLTVPELEFTSGALHTGGDPGRAEFARRYGRVKLPWEADYGTKSLWVNTWHWWIRVLLAGGQGYSQAWIGQLTGEPADPHSPQAHGAAGVQFLMAEGPERILHRTPVTRSFWSVDGETVELGAAFDFNGRLGRLRFPGGGQPIAANWRTEAKDGASYLFGGFECWTAHDIAEYLLNRFLDASDDGGPAWSLSGTLEPLEDDPMPLVGFPERGAPRTVAQVLAELIGRHQGLDYRIVPVDDGFQVQVFSLAGVASSWGTVSLPANATRVPVWLDREVPASVRIVHDETRRHKKIRVLGERITVCCSLFGASVYNPANVAGEAHPYAGSLVPQWPEQLETDYAAATDYERQGDTYRSVFCAFGPPDDWDYHGGLASPSIDQAGNVSAAAGLAFQRSIRKTLDWTPLRRNVDYTQWPPVDKNDEDQPDAPLLPPAVYVGGVFAPGDGMGHDQVQVNAPAEVMGFSVAVDDRDLGILLDRSPRHWLAAGHAGAWSSPAEGTVGDYEKLSATLAFATDHRWGYEITADDWTPADGVHEEVVDDAECWVLAPRTVVGLDSLGMLADSGDAPRVLRIDQDAIEGRLAGILARYYLGRSRAAIEYAGLTPWGGLLGQMLDLRDGAQGVLAAITGVEWSNDPRRPRTRITAGLAR